MAEKEQVVVGMVEVEPWVDLEKTSNSNSTEWVLSKVDILRQSECNYSDVLKCDNQ